MGTEDRKDQTHSPTFSTGSLKLMQKDHLKCQNQIYTQIQTLP
jgi:hypothetical protein